VLLSKQSQYQILLKSHLESVDTLLLICAHGAASGDGFCPRAPRIDLIKNSSYDPLYRSTAAHNLPALGCKVGSQEPSDPSFDIAGGGDELVLEIDLCKALVAGSTQSVAAYELTYGPLNRVALAHLVPKFFALLIAPSLLEHFVIGSYQDRAMRLSTRYASRFVRAVMTVVAKLNSVGHFTAFLLSQFAAVGAGLSIRTDGLSLRNAHIESFDPIFLC